jgi:hypothetical protein
MNNSRRMRWARHAERMGKKRNSYITYWWENQKERDHYKDKDEGGWTILK